MKRIAIFASGSGSNAENIARYFKDNTNIEISLILSNKKDAYVLERAKLFKIPTVIFTKSEFFDSDNVINILKEYKIDLIVLSGFLLLIHKNLIESFPNAIVNIHPALLPKYGGKGMYGMNVHKAVIENGDKKSGISIHFVNEQYDDGEIIFQAHCDVKEDDTPESLAERIHDLEYEHFPRVIEKLL